MTGNPMERFQLSGIMIACCLAWPAESHAQEPLGIWRGHDGEVQSLAFTADGKTLVSSGLDGTVKLWELPGGREVKALKGHLGHAYSVLFTTGETILAVGAGDPGSVNTEISLLPFRVETRTIPARGMVKLWDVSKGAEAGSFNTGSHIASVLRLTSGGKTLVSGGLDGTVKFWDTATLRELETYSGPSGGDVVVALTGDCKCVGWGSSSGEVKVRNLTSGRRWAARHGENVLSVRFSTDGRMFCSAGYDIKLWDTCKGKELATLKGHQAGIFALAFTKDSKTLASASGLYKFGDFYGGEIKLWDLQTNTLRATLRGHKDYVSSVAFSPDELFLVSGSADGTIALWRVPPGKREGK